MTDKVQKIREEVERIINRRLNLINGDYFDLNEETNGLTNEIIDTIELLQEEPLSEDFEEAAIAFSKHFGEWDYAIPCFKEGAIWQKQQLMANAINVEMKVDAGGYPYIDITIELYDYDKDIPLAKEGDKYKVILIKEG